MKIYLYKKENDEEIYYKIDENKDEFILNFQRIKELSEKILENKLVGDEFKIEVSVNDGGLDIYKTTLDNIFKSIEEDEDLFTLYSENNSEKTEENTDELNVIEKNNAEEKSIGENNDENEKNKNRN